MSDAAYEAAADELELIFAMEDMSRHGLIIEDVSKQVVDAYLAKIGSDWDNNPPIEIERVRGVPNPVPLLLFAIIASGAVIMILSWVLA